MERKCTSYVMAIRVTMAVLIFWRDRWSSKAFPKSIPMELVVTVSRVDGMVMWQTLVVEGIESISSPRFVGG